MYLFSLLKSGDVYLHEGKQIIPREVFSSLLSIENLMKIASDDVENYKEEVRVSCEEIKRQAFEAGYQEGLKQFNEQLIFFENSVREMRHELQQQVLPLVLKASKKIVGEELKLSPESIVSIVQQVIKPVTSHHHVKLYLSKQDKHLIEHHKEEIKQLFEKLETFVIEEKSDLENGSCIIETESGIINATLENQWKAMESAFQAFSKRSHHS